jgi:hypothetical protein
MNGEAAEEGRELMSSEFAEDAAPKAMPFPLCASVVKA